MTTAADKRAVLARLKAKLGAASVAEPDPFAVSGGAGPVGRLLGPARPFGADACFCIGELCGGQGFARAGLYQRSFNGRSTNVETE